MENASVFHSIALSPEWNAKTGRAITYEQMEEDIHMLKALNINAVKTSHYPRNKKLTIGISYATNMESMSLTK